MKLISSASAGLHETTSRVALPVRLLLFADPSPVCLTSLNSFSTFCAFCLLVLKYLAIKKPSVSPAKNPGTTAYLI